MSGDSVQLTLSGYISYNEQLTFGEAAKVIALIAALRSGEDAVDLDQPRKTAVDAPAESRQEDEKPRLAATPRDAIDMTEAKTQPEKIVALAAYHLQGKGEDATFTTDDIIPLFRSAREAIPARINRELDSAIGLGWIAEDGDREFYLTARAVNVLEVGFKAIRVKRTAGVVKSRASGVKKPRVAKTPESFEGVEIFDTPMPDVPQYGAIKLKRDKVLWVAKFAKQRGMEGLTNKEIVWLTDKFGEGVPSNDVNGHFRGLFKLGYVNKSTVHNVIRITDAGDAYLKSLVANG